MDAFLLSTGVVALAEMGDKTQLLAFVLASRFRKPFSVGFGILLATLANHAAAAWIGMVAADLLDGPWFGWALGLSFLALGLWTLVPDKLDHAPAGPARFGAFLATLVAFFLVEIGDKTQVATAALAAQHQAMAAVVAGTTLGMMLANIPAVAIGQAFAARLPLRALRLGAALVFIAMGLALLLHRAFS